MTRRTFEPTIDEPSTETSGQTGTRGFAGDREGVGRRRFLATAGVAVGGTAALGGCLGETEAAEETITVTDHVGREVTVPYPVESMVLLDDTYYWAAKLLGVQDRVVGTDGSFDEAFPELQDKPDTGWWRDPNFEQIAELDPQVLVTRGGSEGARERIEEYAETLEPFDVSVVAVDVTELRLDDMRLLAKLLDKEAQLDDFLEWKNDQLARVTDEVETIPDDERPLVYCETDHEEWAARYTRSIDVAGGRNVLTEMLGEDELYTGLRRTVDAEFVLEQDPDVIVLEDSGSPPYVTGYDVTDPDGALELRDQFAGRPAVDELTAVETDRIHAINFKVLHSEQSWLGVLYLAKTFHPDRFADFDPVAVHREYLEDWLDAPYQGTYYVPEPE